MNLILHVTVMENFHAESVKRSFIKLHTRKGNIINITELKYFSEKADIAET